MLKNMLKAFLRKNKRIVSFYYKARFIAKAFSRNLFHLERFMLFMKVLPYTMAGYERLSNAYQLAKRAEKENLQGAFVECGVWKGGTMGIMAYAARKNPARSIWLCDSFEGLPEPGIKDGEVAKSYAKNKNSGNLNAIGECVGLLVDVKKLFSSILKIKEDRVYIERGWFQNTLQKTKERIGAIAILRLDADWYESTRCILENLYDNVVSGGYVIIDDYGHWEGCKKAVDEFFKKRNLHISLTRIDYTGVYFKKI